MLLNHVVLENLQKKFTKQVQISHACIISEQGYILKQEVLLNKMKKKNNYEVIKGEVVPGENRKVEL